MRIVLQRVAQAAVRVDGTIVGEIGPGLLLLVGFAEGDGSDEIEWMAEKVIGLRVFSDAQGRMNLSVVDAAGSILVVSQFTLYGDVRKGRRPSFVEAARPEAAIPLYEAFTATLRRRGVPVATGEFGADMQVELVNDGPVTLVLDRRSRDGG
jgi:D-tyrosyl-tRNA(Tyr) deacylase